MNLYEAKNPLFGKGGVAAPSKNIPVLLKGAWGGSFNLRIDSNPVA